MKRISAIAGQLSPWGSIPALVTAGFLGLGCGGRPGRTVTAVRPPAASVLVGECADPQRDGVVSARPDLVRANRDLGGGPKVEQVLSDRNLCDKAGNCQWNIFLAPEAEGCIRYAGTLAATTLEPMPTSGHAGMRDVRAYWTLASGRTLVQEYRFAHGGYRVVDALLCRPSGDDRLDCAETEIRN
jgi:hypothetical protein